MGCVTAQARSSEWSALIPSRWINWIGVLVVCPTGPDATSDWALVCILVRCNLALSQCLLSKGHDGRIKYDPSIAEELTRLAMVSQRIAVVAEEYILDRLVSQPVQDGMIKPWLIETLAELETHLQELGLDVKLENAREAVKSMQAWLGSKRQTGAYDRMRAEAEAAGEEAEAEVSARLRRLVIANCPQFAAWLSARGAKARATDKLRHIFAAGQPRSEIRRVQWEEQLALFLEQEPRGLVPLGVCPPRPTHFDDDEAEEWWMSRAENTDMVYSAQRVTQAAQQAADWTPARSREHYRLHFGRMVTTPPTAFQSTVGFFHALKQLARGDHSDDPSRRLRVLTCAGCGESAITSHNGKHRCLTIDGVAYGDALSSSRASGVFTKKLVHPCDLLDHPTVGLTAWKNAELEKLQSTPPDPEADEGSATLADAGDEMDEDLTVDADGHDFGVRESSGSEAGITGEEEAQEDQQAALLTSQLLEVDTSFDRQIQAGGLVFLTRSQVRWILLLASHSHSWVDPDLATELTTLPLVLKEQLGQVDVAQVLHLYLAVRRSNQPEGTVLPCSVDTNLDDTPIWSYSTRDSLVGSLQRWAPICVTVCNETPACQYMGYSSVTCLHTCTSTLVGRPQVRLSPASATSFAQLPLPWQQRLLTAFFFEAPPIDKAIFNWSARTA